MKILLTFFVLLFSSSVVAEVDFATWGVVAGDCNDFQTGMSMNDESDSISVKTLLIWSFQSYLSGLNFLMYEFSGQWKKLNENSPDFMFAYVENYCNKNPQETLSVILDEYMLILPYIEK